ncbi:hypothetical protein VNO80_22967 [Phaseolus coccineus]|uniref:Uncharacterized protein n=1 Tax=Phaseolus coccineus TaxID=3886 RepID=A0AAN9QVF9_PHACN
MLRALAMPACLSRPDDVRIPRALAMRCSSATAPPFLKPSANEVQDDSNAANPNSYAVPLVQGFRATTTHLGHPTKAQSHLTHSNSATTTTKPKAPLKAQFTAAPPSQSPYTPPNAQLDRTQPNFSPTAQLNPSLHFEDKVLSRADSNVRMGPYTSTRAMLRLCM